MSIESGYELIRLETYNWGNFHNLNKIDITKIDRDQGPLEFYSSKRATVVAGINGAGKTTLIDPIFCILMPFQNRISLGVIADAEKTGRRSGGRSIADYVLGKHSARDEERVTDPAQYYSRKTGISAVLLVFRHRQTGKMITLTRLWWYSDYKLKEDQGFVVIKGEASIQGKGINLLKEDGSFFESASAFRRGMKEKGRFVEPLNTPTEFLKVASGLLNYTPEDIILLNKAFNIKSISNIDNFVRENMLIEVTKESVDRLCDNIQKASEIFKMIKNEQLKESTAEKILGHLSEAKTQYENQFQFKVEIELAELLPTYRELSGAEKKREDAEDERADLQGKIPSLEEQAKLAKSELRSVSAQISKAPLADRLKILEARRSDLESKAEEYKRNKIEFERVCKNVGIAVPKDKTAEKNFRQSVQIKVNSLTDTYESANSRLQEIRSERDKHEGERKQTNLSLEHYSKHPTLIPDWLYAEKLRCIQDLNLKANDLMFVGELIQIPEKHNKFRRAAESVLRPISRNLLCHPNSLPAVEQWINENKLNSDLTVKRIAKVEMNDPPRTTIPRDSVLHFIEIKPERDNPFYTYLSRWVRASFWHEVVSIAQFNSETEKAVTVEGLVKSDVRTMSKYRDKFAFSLGWDNRLLCAELKNRLKKVEADLKSLNEDEAECNKTKKSAWDLNVLASGLLSVSTDFLNIKGVQDQLIQAIDDIKNLKQKNPEHDKLVEREKELEEEHQNYRGEITAAQTNITNLDKSLIELESVISTKSALLAGGMEHELGGRRQSLLDQFKTYEGVLSRIEQLDAELKKKGTTPHDYKKNKEKSTPSPQQALNHSGIAMAEYKRLFEDPDLVYAPPAKEIDVEKLISQWEQVKERVTKEGLPSAYSQFQDFYTETLFDSTKAAISDINGERQRIERDILAINETLELNNFERLPGGEERYLQIIHAPTKDDQIRAFDRELKRIQSIISSEVRVLPPKDRAEKIMNTLEPFVRTLEDVRYRQKVVDARNHYTFSVKSYKRGDDNAPAEEKETFRGAGSDGKSGGQTAQLCYALLAASIACRFYFYDPVRGKNTLRIFLVDEFTGKFDNEKPQDVMQLLASMGFQAIVLTPMSKLETLRGYTNRVVFVHKRSAVDSVATSVEIVTDDEKSILDSIEASLPMLMNGNKVENNWEHSST